MYLPEEVKNNLAEMQESGAAKTYLRLNQVTIGDRDAFVGDCDSAANLTLTQPDQGRASLSQTSRGGGKTRKKGGG